MCRITQSCILMQSFSLLCVIPPKVYSNHIIISNAHKSFRTQRKTGGKLFERSTWCWLRNKMASPSYFVGCYYYPSEIVGLEWHHCTESILRCACASVLHLTCTIGAAARGERKKQNLFTRSTWMVTGQTSRDSTTWRPLTRYRSWRSLVVVYIIIVSRLAGSGSLFRLLLSLIGECVEQRRRRPRLPPAAIPPMDVPSYNKEAADAECFSVIQRSLFPFIFSPVCSVPSCRDFIHSGIREFTHQLASLQMMIGSWLVNILKQNVTIWLVFHGRLMAVSAL